MTQQFMTNLVKKYDEDDSDFGLEAMKAIKAHFESLPESKSTIDPTRLGSMSVFVTKLRNKLISKSSPIEIEWKKLKDPTKNQTAFDLMDLKEQITFQKKAMKLDTDKWVHSLEVLPRNIADIYMNNKDAEALKKLRGNVDAAKMREETDVLDVDQLMKQLCQI
jgi:hypothetical protein